MSATPNLPARPAPPGGRLSFVLWLHGLLFLSGALALVYEILWLRRFSTLFGATTPATAVTLAAVLLGFTAGSAVLGTRGSRWTRPLLGYAILEAAAGLGALLVEAWLRLYDHYYPSLYHSLAGSPAGLTVARALLTFAALFLPTFCLGGTVPLLGQAVADERRRFGVTTGSLYAINTAGAALGALSVPFFWLPKLGATASYGWCVAGSVMIGALAWWLDQRTDLRAARAPESILTATPPSRVGKKAAASQPPVAAPVALSFRVLLGFAALSGALMFALEVAWGRMFAQVHEHSIYSFAVVLAVFLAGLAGGGALAKGALRRGAGGRKVLGAAWLLGGALVFASPFLFYRLTDGLAYVMSSGGWAGYSGKILGLAFATVLLPTLLAGMALPALMELAGAADGRPPATVLGRLLAANTAGSILGSLAAAFVLPAWLGMWGMIVAAGTVMIVAGEWSLASGRQPGFPLRRGLLWVGLIAAWLIWNPTRLPRVKFNPAEGEKITALVEGGQGIVAVIEQAGNRRVKLDNYYMLGGTASAGDERVQGHLPLLLHPAPKRVAFLGLGTGITAGAAMLHPAIEQLTAIEIVPEVARAAADHFATANLGLLQSSRTRVVTEDARQFLRATREQFDVIVGDLVVPWRRGEAALYFADSFEAARRALAPGGLFCQWLPLFQLSEAEFNIVVATFLDVFPRATLWRGDFAPNRPALALVGQTGDSLIDPAVIAQRARETKKDELNPQFVHAAGIWMFLVGPLDPREPRFATARRNRENQPWLELLGPLAHAGGEVNQRELFVGQPLEAFLKTVRQYPWANTPLARAEGPPMRWRDAGAEVSAATLLMHEGSTVEGEARMRAAAATLPGEVQAALLGPGGR